MVLLDTYLQMPGWVQFLIAWPLPSLISALISRFIFKQDLNSRHRYKREEARNVIWTLSIMYPLFIISILAFLIATTWETLEKTPKLWYRFFDWIKYKRETRQRLKEYKTKTQPKSKPQKEYMHRAIGNRTICGVGNPSAVKRIYKGPINCPICLGIIKRNRI